MIFCRFILQKIDFLQNYIEIIYIIALFDNKFDFGQLCCDFCVKNCRFRHLHHLLGICF